MRIHASQRLVAADEDYRYLREWLWRGDDLKKAKRMAEYVLEESADPEAREAAKALYSSSFLCNRGDLARVLKICSKAVAACSKASAASLTKVVKDMP